jgi:hypothetical protein
MARNRAPRKGDVAAPGLDRQLAERAPLGHEAQRLGHTLEREAAADVGRDAAGREPGPQREVGLLRGFGLVAPPTAEFEAHQPGVPEQRQARREYPSLLRRQVGPPLLVEWCV